MFHHSWRVRDAGIFYGGCIRAIKAIFETRAAATSAASELPPNGS